MKLLTRDRLSEWLADFEYMSSRRGVGLRHIPPHVHRALVDFLEERIRELDKAARDEADATHAHA